MVFNLGNDLDFGSFFAENFSNLLNVSATSHERGRDIVDLVFDAEVLDVFNVFLGESWKINIRSWKTHIFSRAHSEIVETLNNNTIILNLLDLTR